MDGINALQLRDNARAELMQIKDIETGFEYLSKVKAIEVWAKAEKKDSELQNLIAEQKIRTQRILGQLIKDGQDAGEIAKQGDYGTLKQNTVNDKEAFTDKPRTLSEIGLTAKESTRTPTQPPRTISQLIDEQVDYNKDRTAPAPGSTPARILLL